MANLDKDGPFPMKAVAKAGSDLVLTVSSIDARKVAMNKVSIIINAEGTTNTNHWKNPRLEPVKIRSTTN